MDQECWIKLNKLLNTKNGSQLEFGKIINIIQTTQKINKESPFCLIENHKITTEKLEVTPLWISYGGRRTGSTFVYNLLKIIMNSLTQRYLCAWEGDYASPIKFYDAISDNSALLAGILKIHRYEEEIPNLLENDKAKAIISIRDYPNKIKSWWRMVNNKKSPFYKKNINENNLIKFIDQEIEEELKKRELKNCFFIREDEIKINPKNAISLISDFLEIQIHDYSKQIIAERLGHKNIAEDSFKIRLNSSGHDNKTFFHHDHINPKSIYNKEFDFIDKLINHKYSNFFDTGGYLK